MKRISSIILNHYHTYIWLILLGLAGVTAQGIIDSVADIPQTQIFILSAMALLFGAMVAVSRLPYWLSFPAAISFGPIYLLTFWVNLSQPLWQVIRGAVTALMPPFDRTSLQFAFIDLSQASFIFVTRLNNWLATFGRGAVRDPLMPQLFWGFALWLALIFLSWAAWRRQQVAMAMFPAGFLLASAAFFSGELYKHVAIFLLLTLLLQVTVQALRRQDGWNRQAIDYASGLTADLFSYTLPLTICIVLAAFYMPNFSISKVTQAIADLMPWQQDSSEDIASSFGLDPMPQSAIPRAGLTGLPRNHLLGNSPELSQELVMSIRTGELAAVPFIIADELNVPYYYWQAVTYDRYNSAGWVFSANESIILPPETPLTEPQGSGRVLRQIVRLGPFAGNLLHTSGQPLTVTLELEADYRFNQDLVAAVISGDIYTATSWLLEPTPEELRAAGQDYPEEIRQTYLTLPRSLPDRVRSLAVEWTTIEPTPYDKALALEQHLREYPYNLEVAQPPPGRDVAEYFLFDLQEGYCDYYATAMVVMARAVGIPARFTIGYVSSFYDPEMAEYRISEAEAHSWPQLYFPDIGWVDFEPTAGRPLIERRFSGTAALNSGQFDLPPQTENTSDLATQQSGLPVIHPFWWLAVAVILLFVVTNIDYWRLRLLKAPALTETLYGRLLLTADQLGLPFPEGITPYEFARRFSRYIEHELHASRLARFRVTAFWRREIQPIDEPSFRGIQQLAQAFVRQHYAPPQAKRPDKDDLLDIWDELHPNLRRAGRIIRLTRRYAGLLRKTR